MPIQSNEMLKQGNRDFPDRVERAVAAADRLAAERRATTANSGSVASSPEYLELVRLKVLLDVETSRTLVEAARISVELERSNLAEKTSSVKSGR